MISDTNKNRLLLAACLISIPIFVVYSIIANDWYWFVISIIISQFHKLVGNNIAMHRYFAHKSFRTGQLRHKFLAYYTILLASKSPISWAMNHRHHHRYSDLDNDTHNPNKDLLGTVFGFWEFRGYEWFKNKGVAFHIRDLLRDPTVSWIDKNYYKIWSMLILVTVLIDWKITMFCLMAPAGYYHLSANLFNTIGHYKIPGCYRNFETSDNSQNHWLWGILTLGEGFHNNHHHNQTNYNNQIKWYEFDPTAWIIKWVFDTSKSPRFNPG